ncbi:hypothetical protein MsedE_1316 [Metallosphaera sedula]|uniref:Uncharacterized protein n=1 Tax=Metallosphaera sedula TaxID=43687 RepID=A0A0K1T8U0_9CREN|nr:hypothetical protein MsedE_1316 [Metallosphaera sedula]
MLNMAEDNNIVSIPILITVLLPMRSDAIPMGIIRNISSTETKRIGSVPRSRPAFKRKGIEKDVN